MPEKRKVQLYLIPLSATCLDINDTWEMYSTFEPGLNLYSPIPPRYIYSLMYILKNLPVICPSRKRFEDDLFKTIKVVLMDKGRKPLARGTHEYDTRMQEAWSDVDQWDTSELCKAPRRDRAILKDLIFNYTLIKFVYDEEPCEIYHQGLNHGRLLGQVA